jgi:hypothetical protein
MRDLDALDEEGALRSTPNIAAWSFTKRAWVESWSRLSSHRLGFCLSATLQAMQPLRKVALPEMLLTDTLAAPHRAWPASFEGELSNVELVRA